MYDWRKIILKQTDTMKKAIEVLNEESLQIALVVNEIDQLVGSITDGDIRRAIIKHHGLDTQVVDFMFARPTLATAENSREEILDKMNKAGILQIPVVDEGGHIVGLETLQHLIEKECFDNPVFLMAGGFGTRLQPLTDDMPKPLLTVGNKPILETIIGQFIEAGFHDFYISTHYKAEMVRDYFGDGSDWNVSIRYIHEDKPLGTAGALGLLPKDLPELPVLIMNGDLLTKVNFQHLLSFHLEEEADATICVREYDIQVPYGVIKADGQIVRSIEEKPLHKFFVNAGVYVLNPSILGDIDGINYLDMPHLLEEKIKNNACVSMFPLHEYWMDIGQIEQFNQAQQDVVDLF